jgi:hypothetical protein
MNKENIFITECYKPIKIKSIKYIKNDNNVYDLEVENVHTYCTGDNIIGHNSKAKLTRQFFRTYARKMQRLNIACVMTAHLTETIGGYGPSKTVAGGTIMGYMPSIEIRFAKVNAESEIEQSAVGTSMSKIRAEIMKSRFGTHGKRVKFDLDMERGLDPYAGLFDILKDYGFIITAASDLEEQIKNKDILKKSNGWWMFRPWDNSLSESLFKEMQEKELCKSGKFREADIKKFCAEYEWFRDKVAYLLSSIYDKNLILQDNFLGNDDMNIIENIDTIENTDTLVEKPKKKKKNDVQITKVENDIIEDNLVEDSIIEDVE